MNGVLVGIGAYILAQLAVGLLVSRRIRTESDYLVAGRRVGLGLATFSMFATWFGAESCIGAAGKIHGEGLAGGATDPFGYALALLLIGRFLAAPVWERRLTTLADLFRQRFGASAERIAALLMAPTSVFWAAAQIRAFGQVLGAAGGISFETAVLIATGVVIVYASAGGLFADVVTDLIQGIAIMIGLAVLILTLNANGTFAGIDVAATLRGRLDLFGGEEPWVAKADLWAMTLMGSLVAQELFARVLAARSAATARRAATWGGWMYLGIGLMPAGLGLLGPALLPGLEDGEALLPELARRHLPAALFVVFSGALVSAILSTVDSTLLAAAALVSHNLIAATRPALSDGTRLVIARAGVAVMGLIACWLALGSESIFELVQLANGIGSAGVFVLLCFGLFGRVGGPAAAVACLVTGTVTWAVPVLFVPEFPAPYLASAAGALGVFLGVARWERLRARGAAGCG